MVKIVLIPSRQKQREYRERLRIRKLREQGLIPLSPQSPRSPEKSDPEESTVEVKSENTGLRQLNTSQELPKPLDLLTSDISQRPKSPPKSPQQYIISPYRPTSPQEHATQFKLQQNELPQQVPGGPHSRSPSPYHFQSLYQYQQPQLQRPLSPPLPQYHTKSHYQTQNQSQPQPQPQPQHQPQPQSQSFFQYPEPYQASSWDYSRFSRQPEKVTDDRLLRDQESDLPAMPRAETMPPTGAPMRSPTFGNSPGKDLFLPSIHDLLNNNLQVVNLPPFGK